MEWIAAFIVAALFLGWFGNHTAAKYRRLYGQLPDVRPEPKRVSYRSPAAVESYENAMTCPGSYSIRMMGSAVPLSRPGSIVRLEDWQ
jgi:hypothetical protein